MAIYCEKNCGIATIAAHDAVADGGRTSMYFWQGPEVCPLFTDENGARIEEQKMRLAMEV